MKGAAWQGYPEGRLLGKPVDTVWQEDSPVMGAAWQGCLDCRLACKSVHKAKSEKEPNMAQPQASLCVSRGAVSARQEALARSLERLWSTTGSLLCIDD